MWNIEDKNGFDIESSIGRGQINIEQDFGKIIFDLAKNDTNSIFVDIGTWNGLGSTKCFIEAMKINRESTLYTIENNFEKFEFAKQRWKDLILKEGLIVNFLNGSLISNEKIDDWILTNNIELNDTQKYWLSIDKANSTNIIELPVEKIDILLIDGSDFTGFLEMMLLKDISNYILLDDVNILKNQYTRNYLLNDNKFILINENLDSRNGYSIFKKK